MPKDNTIDKYNFIKLFPNKYIFFCFLGVIVTYLFNVHYFIPIGIRFLPLLSIADYIEGSSFFMAFVLLAIYYANTFPWNNFLVKKSLMYIWGELSSLYVGILVAICLSYHYSAEMIGILAFPLASIGCMALIINHYPWKNDIFIKKTYFILATISLYGTILGFKDINSSEIFIKYNGEKFQVVRILSSGVIYTNKGTINYVKHQNISKIYKKDIYGKNKKEPIWVKIKSKIKNITNKQSFSQNPADKYPEVPVTIE